MSWLKLLGAMALSWPCFVWMLYRFPRSESTMVLTAALLLAFSAMPLWRFHPLTRGLAWLSWGPGAPFLAWLTSKPFQPVVLTGAAMIFSILHAATSDGLSRTEMQFRNKMGQVERGRLLYVSEWGWVDSRHEFADVFRELVATGRMKEHHLVFGTFGQCYELALDCHVKSALEARRVTQLVAERCEDEQERLPVWMGSRVSAHNIDDLPSVYFYLFREAHPELEFHSGSPEKNRQRWEAEGRDLVQRKVRRPADFRPAAPQLTRAYVDLFEFLEGLEVPMRLELLGPVAL